MLDKRKANIGKRNIRTLKTPIVPIHDRLKATNEQDRRGKRFYLRLGFNMLDQVIVNSRIVYNTLNPKNALSAKEYLLKISQGIVHGLSSRSHNSGLNPLLTTGNA